MSSTRLLKLECCLACTSDPAMRMALIWAGKWRVKYAVTGSGAHAANHCATLNQDHIRVVSEAIKDDVVRSSDVKAARSEEHTSELQSLRHLVCRLLLE